MCQRSSGASHDKSTQLNTELPYISNFQEASSRGNWGPRTCLCKFQFAPTNDFCVTASSIFVRLEKAPISLDFLFDFVHQLMLSKFNETIYHSIPHYLKIFLVFLFIISCNLTLPFHMTLDYIVWFWKRAVKIKNKSKIDLIVLTSHLQKNCE